MIKNGITKSPIVLKGLRTAGRGHFFSDLLKIQFKECSPMETHDYEVVPFNKIAVGAFVLCVRSHIMKMPRICNAHLSSLPKARST